MPTHPSQRYRSAFVFIFILILTTGCGQAQVPVAEVSEKQSEQDVLAVFVSEFVPITPGNGKFPQTFRASDDDSSTLAPGEVSLEDHFSIAKYEVPQNLYQSVMETNPSRWQGPRNSTERMTYSDAMAFCEKVTRLLQERKLIPSDHVVRLPTPAEWEYSCRAGTTTAYSFGDDAQAPGDEYPNASLLNKYGWHTGNAAGNDPAVGVLAPNPWGLYDMHGYLWEFCLAAPSNDDHDDQSTCPVYGGSWKEPFENLQSSSRKLVPKETRSDDTGFRCVLVKQSTNQ